MKTNYFKLLGLSENFDINPAELTAAYIKAQSTAHPDAALGVRDTSAVLNKAYEALKNPFDRAMHLLSLRQVLQKNESHTHHDAAFLLEQMQLQERIENSLAHSDVNTLESIQKTLLSDINAMHSNVLHCFEKQDYEGIANVLPRWQFLLKTQKKVSQTLLEIALK